MALSSPPQKRKLTNLFDIPDDSDSESERPLKSRNTQGSSYTDSLFQYPSAPTHGTLHLQSSPLISRWSHTDELLSQESCIQVQIPTDDHRPGNSSPRHKARTPPGSPLQLSEQWTCESPILGSPLPTPRKPSVYELLPFKETREPETAKHPGTKFSAVLSQQTASAGLSQSEPFPTFGRFGRIRLPGKPQSSKPQRLIDQLKGFERLSSRDPQSSQANPKQDFGRDKHVPLKTRPIPSQPPVPPSAAGKAARDDPVARSKPGSESEFANNLKPVTFQEKLHVFCTLNKFDDDQMAEVTRIIRSEAPFLQHVQKITDAELIDVLPDDVLREILQYIETTGVKTPRLTTASFTRRNRSPVPSRDPTDRASNYEQQSVQDSGAQFTPTRSRRRRHRRSPKVVPTPPRESSISASRLLSVREPPGIHRFDAVALHNDLVLGANKVRVMADDTTAVYYLHHPATTTASLGAGAASRGGALDECYDTQASVDDPFRGEVESYYSLSEV